MESENSRGFGNWLNVEIPAHDTNRESFVFNFGNLGGRTVGSSQQVREIGVRSPHNHMQPPHQLFSEGYDNLDEAVRENGMGNMFRDYVAVYDSMMHRFGRTPAQLLYITILKVMRSIIKQDYANVDFKNFRAARVNDERQAYGYDQIRLKDITTRKFDDIAIIDFVDFDEVSKFKIGFDF